MKLAFWLGCGSFLLALGQVLGSISLVFAGLGMAAFAWVDYKPQVLCMLKDGRTLMDNGQGAFRLVAFDKWWLCRFSADWTARYESTWAFGKGRDSVWFYVPAPKEGGTFDDR